MANQSRIAWRASLPQVKHVATWPQAGVARPLSDKDRWIAEQIGPTLREKGLLFVGLDVIGEHLTEINVTSPTCIREIDNAFGTNIGGLLMDAIDKKLQARKG
ncbi:Glutathione synthetase [Pseudomonas amygdali pv. lachrymans]|nr:Glutathione synthetase [Pseudomonas amygdali pv. lachrymans]